MTLDQFISEAWRDHGNHTEAVSQRLLTAMELLTSDGEIPKLVALATHVWGEHLGRWDQGINFLRELGEYSPGAKDSVAHAIAGLELAAGKRAGVTEFSPSLQIRSLCIAAAALTEHNNPARASDFFHRAKSAAAEISIDDPANRVLAITANNMAASLENEANRTADEISLMLVCAQTARKYWEVAGTWLEVERAEYRLAMSFLKANDSAQALVHAKHCFAISERNGALPVEMFFACEAVALASHAAGDQAAFAEARTQAETYFNALAIDDKTWCEATLSALKTLS